MTPRFCAFCDKEVVEVKPEDKSQFGKSPGGVRFYHKGGNTGSPHCGRQFLMEDQTYTEVESDRSS